MILNNRFDKVDAQRWWWDHNFCGICNSNMGVALHHIDGCKMWFHKSLFNSIPLCLVCHPKYDGFNSDGIKGEAEREKLTKFTMKYLIQQGKEFDENDKAYLESILPRVHRVLADNGSMLQ